jgi:hypothetical protein
MKMHIYFLWENSKGHSGWEPMHGWCQKNTVLTLLSFTTWISVSKYWEQLWMKIPSYVVPKLSLGTIMNEDTTFCCTQTEPGNNYEWRYHLMLYPNWAWEQLWMKTPPSVVPKLSLGTIMNEDTTFCCTQTEPGNNYEWRHHLLLYPNWAWEQLWMKTPPPVVPKLSLGTIMNEDTTSCCTQTEQNGSRLGRSFPRSPTPTLGLTHPAAQWAPGLFPGGKAAEAWHWPPASYAA